MNTKKKHIYKKNVDIKKKYSFNNAIELLKKLPKAKFNETIDISINLKNTSKLKNINIKGYSILPNNIGKKSKTAIFLTNKEMEDYKINNADTILTEKNIQNIKKKNINFDIILTTPNAITKLTEISKILGPKGLMPNIKYGTILNNINENIVDQIKHKYVKYKTDKNNIIHAKIGNINIDIDKIKENAEKLIRDIKSSKSSDNKNIQIQKITISTTMGPGINININSINM